MNILITGVGGFIGFNLARNLLKKSNIIVYGIDNLSNSSLEKIRLLKKNKKFKFILNDCSKNFLSIDKKIDVIYHLASGKIPRYGGAQKLILSSIQSIKNISSIWEKNNCKLIYASTSDVYGKNRKVPFKESSDFHYGSFKKTRWSYASTKLLIENILITHAKEKKLNLNIVRFFGTYGPYHSISWKAGPQSVFIENIINNKKIEIHGDGKQTRCFTYINDTVKGLIKLINYKKNKIFNFGSNEEISIKNLSTEIIKLLKRNGYNKIIYIPYENFKNYEDVQKRIPSSALAEKEIGVLFNTSLVNGLKKTIKWQRNREY